MAAIPASSDSTPVWASGICSAAMLWRVSSPRLYPAGFIEPCLPTVRAKPPAGPEWIHEIKHDGYRLMVRREAKRVRLFTRRGHDWTHRFEALADAVGSLKRLSSITI